MDRILDNLKENYNILRDAEITVEANPATLTDEKMEGYLESGINRLSIGVQSFSNTVLDILGRIHNKNDAFTSFQKARKAGFDNINLDIMFGIPGQTMKMWKDTVRQCIFSGPTHISLYSLQIEEGTQFYEMYKQGELEAVPDLVDRDMYHTAIKMLESSGYNLYEISNAALPGYESRHNLKYWSYDEYMGIGLGASSYIEGARFKNYSNMNRYLGAIKRNSAPIDTDTVEHYSKAEEMGIYIFTGLRKAAGINLEDFRRRFGKELFEVYDRRILRKYKGMLIEADGRLYITQHGMDISNKIMTEFV
jgi:oxygen-independent coproporphyrinogen-3 oxidase